MGAHPKERVATQTAGTTFHIVGAQSCGVRHVCKSRAAVTLFLTTALTMRITFHFGFVPLCFVRDSNVLCVGLSGIRSADHPSAEKIPRERLHLFFTICVQSRVFACLYQARCAIPKERRKETITTSSTVPTTSLSYRTPSKLKYIC